MYKAVVAFLLFLCAGASSAQTTVPFSFSAGSPARASEVNSNFQALVNSLNSLTARVAKLEGQISAADLAGSYTVAGLQIGLINNNLVETISYGGTLILAANGTFSLTLVGNGFDLPIPGARVLHPDSGSISGTWSLTGNTITAQGDFTGQLAHAAGGRVLVHSGFNNADGSTVLLTFVRSN
jgi:hypothetical protein